MQKTTSTDIQGKERTSIALWVDDKEDFKAFKRELTYQKRDDVSEMEAVQFLLKAAKKAGKYSRFIRDNMGVTE